MLETVLPSHTGDDAIEATLVMVRCHCRIMLSMALLSHSVDSAAEVTWLRRIVDVESCW
jgi:hypothetical protein